MSELYPEEEMSPDRVQNRLDALEEIENIILDIVELERNFLPDYARSRTAIFCINWMCNQALHVIKKRRASLQGSL